MKSVSYKMRRFQIAVGVCLKEVLLEYCSPAVEVQASRPPHSPSLRLIYGGLLWGPTTAFTVHHHIIHLPKAMPTHPQRQR